MACRDFCEISQASARQIIKRLSDAIAHIKNNYITFPEKWYDGLTLEISGEFVYSPVLWLQLIVHT